MPNIQSIDTTGLRQAIGVAAEYSGRTPSVMVGAAGYWICRNAEHITKRANMGNIDSSLGVSAPLMTVQRKGSKRYGQPYKNKKRKIIVPDGSVAMAIILQRMTPGSSQNVRENNRWLIDRAQFSPGASKAQFMRMVKKAARNMVAARHKSIAFIASSLVFALRDLENYVKPRYRRGAKSADSAVMDAAQYAHVVKGEAVVRSSGNVAEMEANFLVGVNGQPGNLDDKHNEAMKKWLTPALQISVYDETARSIAYAAGQEELGLRSAKFSSCGVVVNV